MFAAVMLAMTSRATMKNEQQTSGWPEQVVSLPLMAQSQGLSRHSPTAGPCSTWQWHPNFSLIQSIFDLRDPYILSTFTEPQCSHQQRMREIPSMPQLRPYKHVRLLENEGSLF